MKWITVLSVLTIFAFDQAHAAFYIAPGATAPAADQKTVQSSESTTGTVITHKPARPDIVQPAIGMGKNIPMMIALQQIAPAGWYVVPDRGDMLVSWKGSDSWVESLSAMLRSIDASAVIDWEKRTVVVTAISEPVQAVADSDFNQEAGIDNDFDADVQETPIPVQQVRWDVRVTDNLISSTLQRWAEESKNVDGVPWGVSWESQLDFPVMFNASLDGTFEEAVQQLIQSLAATEAPVQAIIYDNHVVRIVPIGTKIK